MAPHPDILWTPSRDFQSRTVIRQFVNWLAEEKGRVFEDYNALWQWSVTDLDDFWRSVWQFFKVGDDLPDGALLKGKMPHCRWFDGCRVNYAQQVFAQMSDHRPAMVFKQEDSDPAPISWRQLHDQVAAAAAVLRRFGVGPQDRVVAYMPNIPEAVVAMLACASIGAIWSSCSPDFGTRSVIDRFRQIEPAVLFAVDGYRYGGRSQDRSDVVARLQQQLPSLKKTILVPYLNPSFSTEKLTNTICWQEMIEQGAGRNLTFAPLDFNHPLWIVYSSGTTGLPKALVHSHGGILVEQLKFLGLHMDIRPGDRFFWFSTTGWIMWNILVSGLLRGATILLFDGNPGYPDLNVLWQYAEATRATQLGFGAPFLMACRQAGLEPGRRFDLSFLRCLGSTASPLPPEGFTWCYTHVKKDMLLASVSGGTDVCTAFLGASPMGSIRAGQLQCRCLGVRAEAWDDDGRAVVNRLGELVVTAPMPSMPIYLWNDPDGRRYEQSYFDTYPGVWRHGDWVSIDADGAAVIFGRSDATLKRMGVRMGSSEIYSAVESLDEVCDSLVVGFERPGRPYRMPLFVVMAEGQVLDEAAKEIIRERIRQRLSPRHLPDDIVAVDDVPRTLNGKKMEVPVKKILMGLPADTTINTDAMSNPQALDYFIRLAETLDS